MNDFDESNITAADRWRNATRAFLFLFAFLLGIKGLGDGFSILGGDLMQGFFRATENPFLGLMVGILATSMVQSSSVTTALIVGLVAAPENPLPIANAVPMIMGANFGTTITNTIVALAHVRQKDEFKRAFAVSTCDDFFELCSLSVLLPLEITTGIIRRTAEYLAAGLEGTGGLDYQGPVRVALDFSWAQIHRLVDWTFAIPEQAKGVLLILISCVLIYGGLVSLVKLLRTRAKSRAAAAVNWALNRAAPVAMLVGLGVTVLVQSSSVTTSLLVPLAGAGLLSLERAFPVVLGANLGTTMTALLAALAITGPNAKAGLTIALVHQCQSTGFSRCWSRYGLDSSARRLDMRGLACDLPRNIRS